MKNNQQNSVNIQKKASGVKKFFKALAVICIMGIAFVPHPHRQLSDYMDATAYRGNGIAEADSLRRPSHTFFVYTTSAIKSGIQYFISKL